MAKAAIRVIRFRAVGLRKATRTRWKHLADEVRRLNIGVWRRWVFRATYASFEAAVNQYMREVVAWHRADPSTRGSKPRCHVNPLPDAMKAQIRNDLRRAFPDLNERPLQITLDKTFNDIKSKRSEGSAFPLWMQILHDSDSYPKARNARQIPFQSRNSEIVLPETEGGDFVIRLRLDRVLEDGRTNAGSTVDAVVLKTQTSNDREIPETRILRRIAAEELKMAGSNVVYRESTGEWWVHICYYAEPQPKPELDIERCAFLRAGKDQPWLLRIGGVNYAMGGSRGRHIAHVRRQLLSRRIGFKEGYKHARSARKGHGRKRAFGKQHLLVLRWHDFVDGCNRITTKHVVQKAIESGCGKIIYYQPAGTAARTRFLWRAGKIEGRVDASGWDWFDVARKLAERCQPLGIELVIRKTGADGDGPSVSE